MKNTDLLKDLSTEELLVKKKKAKEAHLTLLIIVAVALIIQIYAAVRTKNYAFIAIGIACAMLLLPGLSSINDIDNELKRRSDI